MSNNPVSVIDERVAKLIDPEYHFSQLAERLRNRISAANEAYRECLDYGLSGHFYIGPNMVQTNLPDTVQLKKIMVKKY